MTRYPDDFKEYLKETAPMHEVINSIVGNVQQSGVNYVTYCPFHKDDKPSLMIKPDTNTWSCLGCGAGSRYHSTATASDVYGFLKGYYNYNMTQSIEWLAKFLNVSLPVLDSKQQYKINQYQWWHSKCLDAQNRFTQNLLKNIDAYKYLRNRGIDDMDIQVWQLGFGDAEEVEFVNTKAKITFAIHDYQGNIISFTGRVPFGSDVLAELNKKQKAEEKRITPKYDHRYPLTEKFVEKSYIQNHPFPEFDRNAYLYGISHAKSYINQWKSATLVEGFTDVIQMHKYGIRNTVASLGTSLSDQQVLMLKRAGAKRVLLMRDGDEAGFKAMERDALVCMKHGLIVEVCPLPEGHDPDTLCQSYPVLDDSLSRFIQKKTRTLTQWRVERIYRENQEEMLYHYSRIGEIQDHRIDKVISLLVDEQDPVQQDILIRQYADLFTVSYEALRLKINMCQRDTTAC